MMERIKSLRDKTGAGVMDVKKALDETGGNEEEALILLKKQGLSQAKKKSQRETTQGLIDSYIHLGKIGVLVEVNCETDFVSRNEDFKNFVHEIALQVAQSSVKDANALLKDEYFRDPGKTVDDLLREIIVKTGENVKIKRFAKVVLGK